MQSISRTRALWSVIISGFVWLFLLGVMSVGAQAAATSITLGENKTGSITDASGHALYTIEVGASQSVILMALAVTPDFAPTFRVFDEGGVVVLDTANPGSQNIAQGTPNLSSSVIYTIEVRSANNTAGQFLISAQAGAPLTSPQALTPGTPVNGSVDGTTTRQAYAFSASASNVLLLTVHADNPSAGAVIALRDAGTDEILSLSSARLGGIRYRILSGQVNYLLEVTHSGAGLAEAFSICLATESGSATCPNNSAGAAVAVAAPTQIAAIPSQTPTFAPVAINPADACQVTPARNNSVNVRGGAGTNFNIVGQIAATGTGLVVGKLADNSWFQVNVGGALGWVSATVVILGGNCGGVSIVVLPTAIPPTYAPPPVNAQPNQTTNPPSSNSSDNPPAEAPPAPSETLKLNPSAAATYGIKNLQGLDYDSDIDSDTYLPLVEGNVDASYLGGSCAGFVSSEPTLKVVLTNPLPGLLRFTFIHNDGNDGVMIVQDPDGRFHCGDDSYGTVNPTIDLNGPVNGFPRVSPPTEGTYKVWVGAHTASTSGFLFISNNENSHP